MKKRRIAVLAAAALILCALAALAAGGTGSDPLISLGFLTNTFAPQALEKAGARADEKLGEGYRSAAAELQKKQEAYLARIGQTDGAWLSADGFESKSVGRGGGIDLPAGSGFLFLAGTASAFSEGGELVDVTAGTAHAGAAGLVPGHRYLAAEGAIVTVTAASDAALVAPQGFYSLRAGEAEATPFTDILSTAWYYGYVHYVYGAGLFQGVSQSEFSPGAFMTRGMLATVLYRLAGQPALAEEGGVASFSDVPADAWYAGPVSWAAAHDIVKGTGDGSFLPGGNVTREQMALMLCRYAAGRLGLETPADGDLSVFSDAGETSGWAQEAISWAVGRGIITGRDGGVLDPGGTAGRAEVAAMLQRFAALTQ